MSLSSAEILQTLAQGFDPFSGEMLETSGPLANPAVIRALFLAAKGLSRMEAAEKRQKNLPPQAGMAWTREEEEDLLAGFEGGKIIGELARQHQRTRTAIEARLGRLGKLPQLLLAPR